MTSFAERLASGVDAVMDRTVAPPPRSGQLWHDRRPRPTHLLRRTRTGEEDRDRMWGWVREQTGVDD